MPFLIDQSNISRFRTSMVHLLLYSSSYSPSSTVLPPPTKIHVSQANPSQNNATILQKNQIHQHQYGICDISHVMNWISTNISCQKCNSAIHITNVHEVAQVFVIHYACTKCTFQDKFESDKKEGGTYALPQRFINAWNLSGAQHSHYEMFHALFNMNKYSHTSYFTKSKTVWNAAIHVADKSLERALQQEIIIGMHGIIGFFAYLLPVEIAALVYYHVTGHGLVTLNVSTDTRWSSTRQAMESTTTIGSTDTGKNLFRKNVIRERNSDSRQGTFRGSSKAMEGFGLHSIMTEQVETATFFGYLRVYFTTLTSDHDSTTGSIFRQSMKRIFERSGYTFIDPTESVEPITSIKHIMKKVTSGVYDDFLSGEQSIDFLIQEIMDLEDGCTDRFCKRSSAAADLYAYQLFDTGHRTKNIEKSVAKLVKGLGKSCAKLFQKLVSIGDRLSIEEKVRVCRAYPFHAYLDRHELCSEGCSHKSEVIFNLESQVDRTKFCKIMVYFYELSWVIHCYQYKRRTQKLESNHRTMLSYAPKIFDFKHSYAGRVDLALALRNDGPIALIRTMELVGSECDDTVMRDINLIARRKSKRKNHTRYRTDRVKWNLGIAAIHAVTHSWTYKGDHGLTKQQIKIITKRKADELEADEEQPKKKTRTIKHNHGDKCTGGECSIKHPNAKSKRRVIHKMCKHNLCAKCCSATNGGKKC
jgi:hypothetical protein